VSEEEVVGEGEAGEVEKCTVICAGAPGFLSRVTVMGTLGL
jgi:hypothetical protein